MGIPITPSLYAIYAYVNYIQQNKPKTNYCKLPDRLYSLNSPCSYTLFTTDLCIEINDVHSIIGLFTQWDCLTWKYLKNKAFRFNLCTFVLSSKLSYSKANKRTFPHWINDIHAQQTIWMGFSKYRRSHTVIIFILLMNEKSVSISVYIENKTTKIRLSPCVHITFCTVVTFRYLWILTSYVTGGCCHISVVSECYGSP